MKKGYKKLIFVEIITLLLIFFGSFVLNILKEQMFQIIFWLLLLISLIFGFGYEKDKSLKKLDCMLEVLSFVTIYIVLEYLIGTFISFERSPYQLDIVHILKNTIPIFILIVLEELVRYILLTKGKKNKIVVILSILIFTLFESLIGIGVYNLADKSGIFNTIILIILPSISKNLLLSYITYTNGYKPSILYRVVLELGIFLVPFYPSLGDYIDSIFKIIFPLILLLRQMQVFQKYKKEDLREEEIRKKTSLIITIILMIVLGLFVGLTSGNFKYHLLIIASGSMEPNINIGDGVIVKKLKPEEHKDLKEGEILTYNYEGKIIVHRIIKIRKINDEYIYQTKGDNNETPDNWLVHEKQIIGKTIIKIKYIGYPTVVLNNYLNN